MINVTGRLTFFPEPGPLIPLRLGRRSHNYSFVLQCRHDRRALNAYLNRALSPLKAVSVAFSLIPLFFPSNFSILYIYKMHLLPSLVLTFGVASSVQAALSGYAPLPVTCPSTPLVRTATGISASESSYISSRGPIASAALGAWLQKVNSAFSTANLPTVALTTSGGGLRSLLTGAGVIQALDSRDSNVGTSGLYQGLTYQAGLSGGGWLLSSFAGNNYPTISNLETTLWTTAFAESLLVPENLEVGGAYAQISVDVVAKNAAGYPPTIVDVYGRLLAYQLLKGPDGGVATELSSITGFSNFTSHNVPYPIITSLNVETATGVCTPPNNTVIYEFSPYEFGSFDSGVNAFTQTKYLGTSLANGTPTKATCETNYDNLGTTISP